MGDNIDRCITIMPLFYINTLMYRPCPNCLSFLLQTFPSPADSTFRDRQLFFNSKLKVCFDEVDRTRLQLALQQFAKDTIVLLAIYSAL